MPLRLLYTTLSSPNQAEDIARSLLDARLIACANVIPAVRSLYRWQDEIQDDSEVILLLKTTTDCLDAVRAQILALHPYDSPCLVEIDASVLHPPFAAWLKDSVSQP